MRWLAWALAFGVVGFGVREAPAEEAKAVVSIGDGETSKGDLNGRELPLADAIKSLPATGGRIVILPGTYKVELPASLAKPNMTIAGSGPSTRIAVKTKGQVGLLAVEESASRFTLRDCAFEWHVPQGEASIVTIEASDARFENCVFDVVSESNGPDWATCLNFQGKPKVRHQKIWVTDSQFNLGSWTRAVRTHFYREVFVSGNSFNGNLAEPVQGVLTSSCNYHQFTGNTFLSYGQHDGPNPSTGLLVDNPGGDAFHGEITGNHFHTYFGTGSRVLKMTRAYFSTVTGNVFGRVQGWGNAAIELEECHGVTVSGNQIENCDSGGETAVFQVIGGRSVSIASNVFSDCYTTEVSIATGDSGRVFGMAILNNVFNGRGHPHYTAIETSGGSAGSLAIANNVLNHYIKGDPIKFPKQGGIAVKNNIILSPTPKEEGEAMIKAHEQKRRYKVPK